MDIKNLRILILVWIIWPTHTFAQANFGAWSVGTTDDKSAIYAATANDSDAVFGEYCYFSSKKCSWYVAIDVGCEKDHSYPVLAETDHGSASLEIICSGSVTNGHYSYIFKGWKELETLIKNGSRLGLAMPMQVDEFKVYRFLLDGLLSATQRAESVFSAAITPPVIKPTPSANTRTQTL